MVAHNKKIESLNAKASAHLSSSSFLEAAKCWGQLLALLLPHLQQVSTTTLDGPDEPSAANTTSTPNLHLHFVEAPPLARTVEEEHVFAAFGWGIVYAPKAGEESGKAWSAKEYRKAAVATCYNVALSYHLHGMMDANNVRSLDKALYTYRMARGLLETTVVDVSDEPQDVILLALAIANNEGHVLTSRYDRVGACECLLDVRWLLRYAVPRVEALQFYVTAATYRDGQAIFSLHAPVA